MYLSKILNLTQHEATPDQKLAGVIDLPKEAQERLRQLLTFLDIPTMEIMQLRAEALCDMVEEFHPDTQNCLVMIGGAPYFMPVLTATLMRRKMHPLFAFSKRQVVEEPQADGSMKKTVVFKHEGFVYGGL